MVASGQAETDDMPVVAVMGVDFYESLKASNERVLIVFDGLDEGRPRSPSSLMHEIGHLSSLHGLLGSNDEVDFVLTSRFDPISTPARELSIAWVSPFAEATDSPWCSLASLSLLTGDAVGSEIFARDSQLSSFILSINMRAISQALLPYYRQGLLRLIDGIRTTLRLILVRVLSALSRCPDTIDAVLELLAASRCYGRRTEPSDYTLPVPTSMSVVIGEAARLC
jgi:hypothetical protein